MRRWEPDTNSIGTSEYLGRRILNEMRLIGAQDQTDPLGLRVIHFMETRAGEDISLDRLGKSSIDWHVCNEIKPIAIRHSETFREPKEFKGWRVIRVGVLRKPPRGRPMIIVPDPTDEGELSNKYHALAKLEGRDPYDVATHLLALFLEHGTDVSSKTAPKGLWLRIFYKLRAALWVPWFKDR